MPPTHAMLLRLISRKRTMKRSSMREVYKVVKVGKRYAIARTTKVGKLVEITVRTSTHATRLDATMRLREMGAA